MKTNQKYFSVKINYKLKTVKVIERKFTDSLIDAYLKNEGNMFEDEMTAMESLLNVVESFKIMQACIEAM